jgi:hypothetical protein
MSVQPRFVPVTDVTFWGVEVIFGRVVFREALMGG